ncbi:MAG TPA: hypothetical protein PLI12_03765, partial [Acetobacteraceae bacterium]|nr:hypothetical protein [Acetobacteraceae bacterium]
MDGDEAEAPCAGFGFGARGAGGFFRGFAPAALQAWRWVDAEHVAERAKDAAEGGVGFDLIGDLRLGQQMA